MSLPEIPKTGAEIAAADAATGELSPQTSTSGPEPVAPAQLPGREDPPDPGGDGGDMGAIYKTVAVVGLAVAVVVGYFAGRGAGASAAYGATLGLGNLLLLGRMVRAFLGRDGASKTWVLLALTKLAVLLLAMYLPVRAGLVQVLPFVIGFGALPLGIVLGQLVTVPPKRKEN